MKTLLVLFGKSLREPMRVWPLAVIVLAIVTTMEMPGRTLNVRDLVASYSWMTGCVGAIFAIVLALLQTWPLQRTDVRGWLLARPAPRWQFYVADLLAAFVVYVGAIVPVWLIAYIWLGSVAPATRPAYPWMLVPGLLVYLAALSFHPATVWMMSRPAHWIGSKTIPLVLAITVTALAYGAMQIGLAPWAWALVILVVIAFVCLFPTVACDAYTRQSNQPTHQARSSRFITKLSAIALLACVAITGLATTSILHGVLQGWLFPTIYPGNQEIKFTQDGQPIFALEKYLWNESLGQREYQTVEAWELKAGEFAKRGKSALDSVPPSKFQSLLSPHELTQLWSDRYQSPFQVIRSDYYYEGPGGLHWIYHNDGYYLMHVDPGSVSPHETLLAGTLDRSGFDSTSDGYSARDPISRFSNACGRSWLGFSGDSFQLVDRDGIYFASRQTQKVEPILHQVSRKELLIRFIRQWLWLG